MTQVYLGLGSNLGNRKNHLEAALTLLHEALKPKLFLISSIYETPALLPEHAPAAWDLPYFNLVLKTEFTGTPNELLEITQKIEADLGRVRKERWEPRKLDIDILSWDGVSSSDPNLTLPHPGIWTRQFVSTPYAELTQSRVLDKPLPRLMGILNITPDSFSDGGVNTTKGNIIKTIHEWDEHPLAIFDLGAESTRPRASKISATEEWDRLKPTLDFLKDRYRGKWIKPLISIDTHKPEVAQKALAFGIDMINDVNGTSDPHMLGYLKSSHCKIVVMHSLSVPADPMLTLDPEQSAAIPVFRWMEEKLEHLEKAGIKKERIIFDPGIGFGKTSPQSLQCLKAIPKFRSLGCPVLVGHSRKSFLNNPYTPNEAKQRDPESIGVSVAMAAQGVDILRVHNPDLHHRAILAWQRVSS